MPSADIVSTETRGKSVGQTVFIGEKEHKAHGYLSLRNAAASSISRRAHSTCKRERTVAIATVLHPSRNVSSFFCQFLARSEIGRGLPALATALRRHHCGGKKAGNKRNKSRMQFAYERSAQANLSMSSALAPLGDPFHQPSGSNEVVKSAPQSR